jgi:tetratricopeptide (TPR) repeat protein
MTRFRTTALASALALGAIAPRAGAQQAAGKCDIDVSKPNQVKDANVAITTAGIIGKPEDRHKKVVEAVKQLTTKPEAINNQPGRGLVLGRALVMLATEPNATGIVQKSTIGYASGSPTETVDLLAAADTAFRLAEQVSPACIEETEQYRRAAYAPIVNAAVPLYNNQQVDSALALVRRALAIYPDQPLSWVGYNILGAALISKGDTAGSIEAFSKMAKVTATDTSTKNEHKDALSRVAEFSLVRAQNAAAGDKQRLAKEAATRYDEYLKEYPDDVKAQGNRAAALQLAGDTQAVGQIFQQMVADPSKYSDTQLFESGVAAARAEKAEDAAKLFEAGLEKNPYNRDGLFNLAVTYNSMKQYDKMPPILDRLLALDPNNPEAYQLYAIVYQERARATKALAEKSAKPAAKGTAAKRPQMDPATVKLFNAQNDSVLIYFKKFQEAPVKVSFNLFSHDGTKHVLGGNIENLTDAEKSYDLKVEFLDATGKVVTTGSAKVDAVPAKGSKPFRVEVTGDGIAAFRYAPIA